jgi:hypothetical protein
VTAIKVITLRDTHIDLIMLESCVEVLYYPILSQWLQLDQVGNSSHLQDIIHISSIFWTPYMNYSGILKLRIASI